MRRRAARDAHDLERGPEADGRQAQLTDVYREVPDFPGSVIVAVGMFADPAFEAPTFSVHEDRKHAWVLLPDSITDHMA